MSTSILAVDDDDGVRRHLIGRLSALGYEVSAAASAEEALDLLKDRSYDLVLAGIDAPGAGGFELSRSLTEIHADLPVILVTRHHDPVPGRSTRRNGAADPATRPAKADALHVVIERGPERREQHHRREAAHDVRLQFRVVKALAAVIDARQAFTAEHSRRVAAYAVETGADLGLDMAELHVLDMAAQVHDLGKIGVPDDILHKPAALTPQEWRPIRQHPARGASIVGQVPELQHVADAVRHHHERIDGKGYPDRLKGSAIPLLSRIISVADAYDAMTSERPYRAAITKRESLGRLREASGTQFDAMVVDAFVRRQLAVPAA